MSLFKRSRAGRIDAYDLGAPATWYAVPQPTPAGFADELTDHLVGLLDDGEQHRVEVLHHVKGVVAEVTAEPHLGVAVWAPDPARPVLCAAMFVDFVVPDDSVGFDAETLLDIARNAGPPAGAERLSRSVELVELPAGAAVLQRDIVADQPGGEVEENIKYTVFPPGAVEALSLAFAGPHLNLGELLEADAQAIAASLTVELV